MENNNHFELYDLEKIRFIIKDACALDIAYAYDDLVFSEHGILIIKFVDNTGKQLHCWFNNELNEKTEIDLFDSLAKTAKLNGSLITYKGRFEMHQRKDSEEIDITFENR